jgi:site-specific DNA recombinase
VPTYSKRAKWHTSVILRCLKNENYVGVFYYRKNRCVRDPVTGQRSLRPNDIDKIVRIHRPDLRIISNELWEKVQNRLLVMRNTHPKVNPDKVKRKSHQRLNSPYLLSRCLKCGVCDSSVALAGGKKPGYYGCMSYRKRECHNNVLVPKPLLEDVFLSNLFEKVLTPNNVSYILKKVEKELRKIHNTFPEKYKQKVKEKKKIEKGLINLINFIQEEGKKRPKIGERIDFLTDQLNQIEFEIEEFEKKRKLTFRAPPKEWVISRLNDIKDILNMRSKKSSALIKDLVGDIKLTPIYPKNAKPHYRADCDVFSIAILEKKSLSSSQLRWWAPMR